MKPSPQISPIEHASRSFPLTDYSYQTTMEAPASAAPAVVSKTNAPAFYKISSEFFGAESSAEYIAELCVFGLVTAVAAWPVISMLACLAWMKMVV